VPDNKVHLRAAGPGQPLGYTAWGVSATALELVNSAENDLSFEDAPGIVGVVEKDGPRTGSSTFVDAVGMPVLDTTSFRTGRSPRSATRTCGPSGPAAASLDHLRPARRRTRIRERLRPRSGPWPPRRSCSSCGSSSPQRKAQAMRWSSRPAAVPAAGVDAWRKFLTHQGVEDLPADASREDLVALWDARKLQG
jgi:hypothetical protein